MSEVDRIRKLLTELEAKQARRQSVNDASLRATLFKSSSIDSTNTDSATLYLYDSSRLGIDQDAECLDENLISGICLRALELPKSGIGLFAKGRTRFIDIDDFEDYLGSTLRQAAFEKSVSLLGFRDRTRLELATALRREGYSEEIATDALSRLATCGLLDEARYAESFIRTKLRSGWGQAKIERELQAKGVHLQDIEGYPELYFDKGTDMQRAIAALRKKPIPTNRPMEKFTRFLIGRGFPYDVAMSASKAVLEDERSL